ncbi:MAG: LacI family DNA-binding transcriptional regulator [Nitratireductor sp.]|nr:LacI family DNA-binding transcriptional regulator [Nitratireductor sp.]
MSKVSLADVAARAGVSLATVDRAANGRPGVSQRTIEKIRRAAAELNYRKSGGLGASGEVPLSMLVAMPVARSFFFKDLVSELKASRNYRPDFAANLSFLYFEPDDTSFPGQLAARALAGEFDAVAVFGANFPGMKNAIHTIKKAGIKVICIISDLDGTLRDAFVGQDNIAAGRTAATLFARYCSAGSGQVQLMSGYLHLNDQEERVEAFQEHLRKIAPQYRCRIREFGDGNNERTDALTRKFLMGTRNPAGIYGCGGGHVGIIRALAETGKPKGSAVVVHDLTEQSGEALRTGLVDCVIDQSVAQVARACIRKAHFLVRSHPTPGFQDRINIGIYIAENVPDDISMDA